MKGSMVDPGDDPRERYAYLAEGNAKQARKRVGADAILRDQEDRILLVDPSYKPDWDLPGGMAEANESPSDTAHREIKEELGLDVQLGRLLCVDWVSPHGPWDDSLMFIFDGGILAPSTVRGLHPVDDEILRLRFCAESDAAEVLRSYVWRRLQAALRALRTGQVQYLQDGHA